MHGLTHCKPFECALQAGAEVNAGTDQKWTSLHLAAKEQNTGVVRVLLDNNADGALKDSYGATALHYAVQLADLAHFNALHSQPHCVVKTPDKKGMPAAAAPPAAAAAAGIAAYCLLIYNHILLLPHLQCASRACLSLVIRDSCDVSKSCRRLAT